MDAFLLRRQVALTLPLTLTLTRCGCLSITTASAQTTCTPLASRTWSINRSATATRTLSHQGPTSSRAQTRGHQGPTRPDQARPGCRAEPQVSALPAACTHAQEDFFERVLP